MQDIFSKLAAALSEQMGLGTLRSVAPTGMGPDEKGYSGAELVRLSCTFSSGETGSFICKYAGFEERNVLQILTEQKRGHTPVSYSDTSRTGEAAWVIMQDIRPCEPVPRSSLFWKRKVAAALADIHADNIGRADSWPRSFHADQAYWEQIIIRISLDHFEKQCASDHAFAAQYSRLLPQLRRRAGQFARDMTALYRGGASLTVTHGDLQTLEGDHVRCFQGQPMIIDWGFSRYAPFYIDLVDYFTREEAGLYWTELQRRGIGLSKAEFDEGYRMASVYPALIYLYPALAAYNRGSAARLEALLSKLCET